MATRSDGIIEGFAQLGARMSESARTRSCCCGHPWIDHENRVCLHRPGRCACRGFHEPGAPATLHRAYECTGFVRALRMVERAMAPRICGACLERMDDEPEGAVRHAGCQEAA